jgi:hypothetical protein
LEVRDGVSQCEEERGVLTRLGAGVESLPACGDEE